MELERGGFKLIKVTDYGIVKSSRKRWKRFVKLPRECFKTDERQKIAKLSTEKKNAYNARKLTALEAGMPMSGKKRKRVEDLKEKPEENRSVRSKGEEVPDILNTPANVCLAESSREFRKENLKVENIPNFKIAPLTMAAQTSGLNGGKVMKIASIFENLRSKEVKNILKGVSQAEDPGLANRLANGREPSMGTGKKRTWELGQKGAVMPPNVIGADFVPESN